MKSTPDDSDKESPWYRARFVYDLSKLVRARLKEVIQSLSYPEHPPPSELLPERDLPYDEWKVLTSGQVRVELQDGRKACLFLGPLDAEKRYRGARVFEIVGEGWVPLEQIDAEKGRLKGRGYATGPGPTPGVLAVLAATQEVRVEPGRVWKAHLLRKALLEDTPDLNTFLAKVRSDSRLKDARRQDLREALVGLGLPEALLRETYPNFDDLPERERAAMLMQVCVRINKIRDAVEDLRKFLQRGTPEGLPKRRIADPGLDVRSAELRDSLGLTHRRIGEILHLPLAQSYQIKGHHKRVGDMIERGRKMLVRALGQKGYRAHLEAIESDLRHFYSPKT